MHWRSVSGERLRRGTYAFCHSTSSACDETDVDVRMDEPVFFQFQRSVVERIQYLKQHKINLRTYFTSMTIRSRRTLMSNPHVLVVTNTTEYRSAPPCSPTKCSGGMQQLVASRRPVSSLVGIPPSVGDMLSSSWGASLVRLPTTKSQPRSIESPLRKQFREGAGAVVAREVTPAGVIFLSRN